MDTFLRLFSVATKGRVILRTDQLAGSRVAMQTSHGGRGFGDFPWRYGPGSASLGVWCFISDSQGNGMRETELPSPPQRCPLQSRIAMYWILTRTHRPAPSLHAGMPWYIFAPRKQNQKSNSASHVLREHSICKTEVKMLNAIRL